MSHLKKISSLFEDNDNNKLVLPDFQRDLEWKIDQQKKLLASVLVALPIGSLLILKGNKDDFAAKKLCFPKEIVEPKEECLYLLDGQQRISSLKSIFFDFFNDHGTWLFQFDKLYSDLRNRWFLRVRPNDDDEEDIFGWKNLQFKDLKFYEPSQIIDWIDVKKVYKTKNKEWYNPGFMPKDEQGNALTPYARNNKIAKLAADEGIVPLYTVNSESKKPLHESVIEKIASDRVDALKASVEDNVNDPIQLLEYVEPDISEIIRENDGEKIRGAWAKLGAKWSENLKIFIKQILEQEITVIELPSNEISRAVSIFESINKGGTPLDTYDLIVAKAARNRDLPSLTKRITNLLEEDIDLPEALTDDIIGNRPSKWDSTTFGTVIDNKISNSLKDQYLNLLSIFSYTDYGSVKDIKIELIKRNKQLSIDHELVNSKTSDTINAIKRAYAFLQFRCGIVGINDLPYKLMILPMAYSLFNDDVWGSRSKLAKIEYWYWCSLFSGTYKMYQNEQCIKDIKNLYAWLNTGDNPFKSRFNNVLKDIGYSDLNVLLMKDDNNDIPGAVSKGVLQYILSKQPLDFLPESFIDGIEKLRLNAWEIAGRKQFTQNNNVIELAIEDHHICPLSDVNLRIDESSKKIRKDKKHVLNSPLNRTYISSISNKAISSKTPDRYLQYVTQSAQWGHCIPTPIDNIYKKDNAESQNDFYECVLRARYNELYKDLIEELERLVDMN